MLPIQQSPLQIQSSKNLSSDYAFANQQSLSPNYGQSNISLSKIINQTNIDLFRLCKNILKKNPQTRTNNQLKNLIRLSEHNKFLADFIQNLSIDCFKNVMRTAKIQEVKEKQLLCNQGKPITHMVVVLDGKLGICKKQQNQGSFLKQCKQLNSLADSSDSKKSKNKQKNNKNYLIRNHNNNNNNNNNNNHRQSDESHHSRQLSQYQRQKQLHKQHMLSNIFDGLTQISCKQIQHMRSRGIIINRKLSLPITASRKIFQQQLSKYEIQKQISQGEIYGAVQRINSKYHPNTCITLQNTILMIIDVQTLMMSLQLAFKTKMNQTVGKLKQIPCFSFLQEDKINQCILCMRKDKIKRNQFLYKQGDKTEKAYILINGQVKLTKQAKLFQENPNQFYVDRRKLMNKKIQFEKDQNVQKVTILPYANLTSLYNYRPIKKTIQIGIITSSNGNFSLIGEQQMIQKRPRQTNAMINSFDAQIYQIDIKKMQQILGNQLMNFYVILEKSLRKVILYRQNQYAQKVINQNKKNMNYFYYQGNKVQSSPRKYKIQKINNHLGNGHHFIEKQKQNKDNAEDVTLDQQQKTKPFYNTFNFQKLMKQQKKPKTKPLPQTQRKSDHLSESKYRRVNLLRARGVSTQFKKKKQQSLIQENDQTMLAKYDPLQERLMGLSHSWKPMKKKVGQEIKVMQKISAKRHTINLLQPLIEQQYFNHVDKEQKRINRQHKIFKLSLGKRTK